MTTVSLDKNGIVMSIVGIEDCVISAAEGSYLISVFKDGYREGKTTTAFSANIVVMLNSVVSITLKDDENPNNPVGKSRIYHGWVSVPKGGGNITVIPNGLSPAEAKDVVLSIGTPKP